MAGLPPWLANKGGPPPTDNGGKGGQSKGPGGKMDPKKEAIMRRMKKNGPAKVADADKDGK